MPTPPTPPPPPTTTEIKFMLSWARLFPIWNISVHADRICALCPLQPWIVSRSCFIGGDVDTSIPPGFEIMWIYTLNIYIFIKNCVVKKFVCWKFCFWSSVSVIALVCFLFLLILLVHFVSLIYSILFLVNSIPCLFFVWEKMFRGEKSPWKSELDGKRRRGFRQNFYRR